MPPTPRAHTRLRLVPATTSARSVVPPAWPASESTLDDSQLLLAVRASDASVASALHDRLRPVVDRAVRRLLGRGDAERDDVTQIALLEILSSIDSFRGDSSLDAWASMVTAHVVYKRIRRRKLERAAFALAPVEELYETTASTSQLGEDVESREIVNRVVAHLASMDPGRAWAFALHDVWGYDLRETASILDVSVAAAQSRLVRGRHEIHARVAADPALAGALESDDARDGGAQ